MYCLVQKKFFEKQVKMDNQRLTIHNEFDVNLNMVIANSNNDSRITSQGSQSQRSDEHVTSLITSKPSQIPSQSEQNVNGSVEPSKKSTNFKILKVLNLDDIKKFGIEKNYRKAIMNSKDDANNSKCF